ncbi:hypothetical protein TNIN_381791, partial [Trichonephila inaurata madagascariensis]
MQVFYKSIPKGYYNIWLEMKNLVDCRYFLNYVCEMGKKCPYRHCEQARITHIECPRFVQRKCNAITCRFRHTVDK